jgi:hypothetical protein
MVKHYKPVIVVIKKPKHILPPERMLELELPLDLYPEPLPEKITPKPIRGVTILKISGDEKI